MHVRSNAGIKLNGQLKVCPRAQSCEPMVSVSQCFDGPAASSLRRRETHLCAILLSFHLSAEIHTPVLARGALLESPICLENVFEIT